MPDSRLLYYNGDGGKRQYNFLRSAVKVEAKVKGNKIIASVYIDTDSVDRFSKSGKHEIRIDSKVFV